MNTENSHSRSHLASPRRNLLRDEVLVVLAVAFLSSASFAAVQFLYDLLKTPSPMTTPVAIVGVPVALDYFDFAFRLLGRLVKLAPVALVAHLLAREGGSLRLLGFDRTRLDRDVVAGIGLAMLGVLVTYGAYAAGRSMGFLYRPIIPFTPGAHPIYWFLIFVTAAVAALSEELILNAYLLRRLDELGWSRGRALSASALLRGAIHLYQGWGGLVNGVVGGLVLGRIFQRTNRIAPIVIAHFMYDILVLGGYLWLRHVLPFID